MVVRNVNSGDVGLTLAVGTPYKENSITQIAGGAARRNMLSDFYTTVYTGARAARLAQRVPNARIARSLEREFGRRSFPGVPPETVRLKASAYEIAYVASRRLHLPKIASRLTFVVKERFDREMAGALRVSQARAVVGMWGSAAATLACAKATGRFGVLNYVNSHPRVINRLLRDLADVPAGHHEYVPPQVIEAVEREMGAADLLLVPSEFVASELRALGIADERIAVEPYGVDLSAFRPPAAGRPRSTNGTMHVLCIALVAHRKGIRTLVAAARRLEHEGFVFHLSGAVVEPSLLEGVPSNFRYEGIRVQSEVVAAMQAADVFVLPSIEDAYPLAVMEAMATGLPPIVSDHVGVAERLENGVTGSIVPAGNVDRLVDAIAAYRDADLRERVGSAAERFVRTNGSWDMYAANVLAHIEARIMARGR